MTPELRAGAALDDDAYAALTQRAVFDCCKWNLTAHDTPTVSRFPLLVRRAHYEKLARTAAALAAEALAAEHELLARPELHQRLGLPPALLPLLRVSDAPRFLRIDFHPTPDGYRITEANSDVAGGFIDGSGVAKLWGARGVGTLAGDPAGALAAALQSRFGANACVGLMHLTHFIDDRMVVAYLERRFREAGLRPMLFDAYQLRSALREVDAVFRFFPGEWLEQLPAETGWAELVASPRVCNPLSAMLTATKRFPLVWPELKTPLPTWRALTPKTFELGENAQPVLKPALGNEGTGVSIRGVTASELDAEAARRARAEPGAWVAQERFESTPISTPDGARHVAVGVYVIDGRASGAYARLAAQPFIGADAQDAVVLLENE